MIKASAMRCYHLLVHGGFDAHVLLTQELPTRGFYAARWVLARSEATAKEKALRSIRNELQKWSDIRDGLVSVAVDVERIERAPPWRLLDRAGRGFTFYGEE